MDKFQVLLQFAIDKRIKNRTFIGWNVLLFLLIFGLTFGDQIVLQWNPSFYVKQKVYVYEIPDFVSFANEHDTAMEFLALDDLSEMEMVLADMAWVVHREQDYQVISNSDLSPMPWITLSQLILTYEDMLLRERLSEVEYRNRQNRQVIPIKMGEEKESSVNQTWAFLMITSIYFVALSYVGIAASDVVHEKSTRMMELILTCVSSTTHLIAKLLSGWLVLIFQVVILGGCFLFAMIVRYMYDKGAGLLQLMVQLELIPHAITLDLKELLRMIQSQSMVLPKFVVGILFMLIGILFVQTLLVILSSFVGSIEESGTVQSPFYLMFMGIYYLTIFLNTPTHMSHGIGKVLSMFPFFSMLFMPCRMFYYEVTWFEIAISLGIAVVSLLVLWMVGAPIYQIGVLDYSSQPIGKKLHTSFRDFVSKFSFQRG